MLFAAIVAVISGFDSYRFFAKYTELNLEWMKKHGCGFENGVPSHDAFRNLFSQLDPSLLSACLRSIAAKLHDALDFEFVSIDGKAEKRGKNRGGKTPFIVNAWADAHGIVLGEVKVEDKSNEITAVPKLLKLLDLEGCIVTIDAMGCQKKIAAKIFIEKKAHYILALKDNQKTFHEEMRLLFENEMDGINKHLFKKSETVIEKHHGRIDSCPQVCKCASVQAGNPEYSVQVPVMSKIIGTDTGRWVLPVCKLAHLHIKGQTAEGARAQGDSGALGDRKPTSLDARRHLRRGLLPGADKARGREPRYGTENSD